MSYTHTLGALTIPPLPRCAPAEVIADARIACSVASAVHGLGALTSMLSLPAAVRPYADDPAWRVQPACDVQRLPVCPKVSATTLTYKVPVTVATYTRPKVPAIIARLKTPVTPPTLHAVTVPGVVAPVPVRVFATAARFIPPAAPRAPTLQAAAQMVKMGVPSVLVQMPDKTVVAVEDPDAEDEGMSGTAKAGILALLLLLAYGAYRATKKG